MHGFRCDCGDVAGGGEFMLMCTHTHLRERVHVPPMPLMTSSAPVPLWAPLQLDDTMGALFWETCCTFPLLFPTLPLHPPPPPSLSPNRNVIKKGSLWPRLAETVHTNHVQPFRRKTCRIHTSHFHLQKSPFFH